MRGKEYNPIIGYLLVDKKYQVLGPPGEKKDVAYHTEARAKKAAAEYGYEQEVGKIAPLHLGGILSVIWDDVGDIYLDGPAAKGLVKACGRRRIKVNKQAKKRIKSQETGTVYSSRELVGDKSSEQVF